MDTHDVGLSSPDESITTGKSSMFRPTAAASPDDSSSSPSEISTMTPSSMVLRPSVTAAALGVSARLPVGTVLDDPVLL